MQRRRKSTTSVSVKNSSRVSRAARLEAVRRASLATYELLENRQMLSVTTNPLPLTGAPEGWTTAYFTNQGGGSTNPNSDDPLNDSLGVNPGQGAVAPIYSKITPTIEYAGNQNAGPPGVPGYNNGANFSIRYDGYLKAPNSGTATFWAASDDGVQVAIDETPVSLEQQGAQPNWVIVDQRMTTARGTGGLGGSNYNEAIQVGTVSAPASPTNNNNGTQSSGPAFNFVAGELYHVMFAVQNGGGGWGAHLGWSGAMPGITGNPVTIPQADVYAVAPAVTNFTVNTGVGVNEITWNSQVSYANGTVVGPAASYTIMRSTDFGNTFPTTVATITPDYSGTNAVSSKGFTYIDTTAVDGAPTGYVYEVIANNSYASDVEPGQGVQNNGGQLPAPTHVTAIRNGTNSVVVSWDGEFSAVGGFAITRYTVDNNGNPTNPVNVTTAPDTNGVLNGLDTSFTDTSVAANTNYFYTVTALHGATANTDVTDSAPSVFTFVGFGDGWDASYYGFRNGNNDHTADDARALLGFQRIETGPIEIGAPTAGNGDNIAPPNAPAQWFATGANQVLANPATGAGDNFAGRWVGYVEAPVTGYYTFDLGSDDGNDVVYYDQAHLDVNGNPTGVPLNNNQILANRGVPNPFDVAPVVDTNGQPVLFTAGQKYLIQYEFNNGGGGWGANLQWSASAGTNPNNADLMAQQYVPAGDVMAPLPVFSTIYANDVGLDGSGNSTNAITGANVVMGSVTKDASFYAITAAPSDGAVQITWNNIGASSYNVYIYDNGIGGVNPAATGYPGVGANPVTLVGSYPSTSGASITKTISGLTNNHQYTIYISGVDQTGETPFAQANKVTVTPQPVAPAAPTNVTVITDNTANFPLNLTAGTDNALVSWTAAPFAASYNVYRDGVKISTDGAVTGTTFHDPNRPLGSASVYTVTAVNTGGEGAMSTGATFDLLHGSTEAYYSDQWWYGVGFNNPGYTDVAHAPDNLTAQPNVNFNNGNQAIPNIGASQADQAAARGFNYSTVYEGVIVIPVSGNYNIGAESDDNSALILNGQVAYSDAGYGAQHFAPNTHYNAGDQISFIMFSQQSGGGHQQNLLWNYVSDDTLTNVATQNIPQANLLILDSKPAAPTAVTAANDGTNASIVDVTFTDNATREMYFTLLRSTSPSGPFTPVGTGAFSNGTGASVMIQDTNKLPGTYYYEVSANNLYGGNTSTATTAPVTVTVSNASTEHFYNNQYWGSTTNANNYLTPSLSPNTVSTQPTINQGDNGIPAGSGAFGSNQNFSDVFTGRITLPTNGTQTTSTYLFDTASDDDSYFVVNGQMVSSYGGPHGVGGAEVDTPIVLTPGATYDFQYYHSNGGGGWQWQANWVLPNADGTAGSLGTATNGEYSGASVIPASAYSPTETIPAAPIALTAAQTFTNLGSTSVTVTYSDPSLSELEFHLQRSTSSDFSTGVTDLTAALHTNTGGAASNVSFNDTGLAVGTLYYYRVAAVNYTGASTFTNLGSITTETYNAPTYFSANPGNSLETVLQWTNAATNGGAFVAIEKSTDNGATWTEIATKPNVAGANDSYHITGGTAGTITYYRIRGVDVASPGTPVAISGYSVAQAVNPVAMPSTPSLIDYSVGFPASAVAAGGPLVVNSTNGPASVLADGNLQLTDNNGTEARTVWTSSKVSITNFTTTFDYTATAGTGIADGFTFTIQNDPRGSAALGDTGGSKGVGGGDNHAVPDGNQVTNSVSLGLNPYPNQNQAVVFLNGVVQNGLDGTQSLSQDLTAAGIDLHAGHTFQITIGYDGTNLSASITDVTSLTHPTASFALPINLQTQLGNSTTGYVGFSGGTGGAVEQQLISNWTYAIPVVNGAPTVAAFTVPASQAGTAFASTPVNFTGTNGDTFTAHVDYGDGSGVVDITGLTVTGGNGTFNISHTYATAGSYPVSITVTDNTSNVTSSPATTATATVNPAAPTFVSRVLDDGTAQKSMIRSLTYTFSTPVKLSAGAVTLFQLTGVTYPSQVFTAAATNVDASAALGTPVGSGTAGANGTFTIWTIPIIANATFATTLLNSGGATLDDGIYQTTVHAALVTDAVGQTMAGGDNTGLKFHRLYGDINGDQRVNAVDYGQFNAAFGSNNTLPNYVSAFDYSNDHRINASDYGQFVQRFGKALAHSM
ncbi:MAG TPA: PA14 domain-containing protein [Tepidisphaeraceae bacterium]|jgi:hypothetical protein|nr:PA14 domain-containing protein [Tepidisphaeraceae bacterium]